MAAGITSPRRRTTDMQVEIPRGTPAPVGENIRAVLQYHAHEEHKVSPSQHFLEHLCEFIGRPAFMAGVLILVGLWIAANLLAPLLGLWPFDPPQFFWLQGLISLVSLLITNVVLMRQNRQMKLQQHRAHLDLEISLLAEQKISKLIELTEQIRNELPQAERHDDPELEVFKHAMDAQSVIAALEATLEATEGTSTTHGEKTSRHPGARRREKPVEAPLS